MKHTSAENLKQQTLILPDGRNLAYCIIGKGPPVLYFHGTASSRLEILLLEKLAKDAQLQIIGFDRPGYGLSTFQKRTTLKNFLNDVNFLAKHLELEGFGVLGWSGGGVFALAYLASFPEHVKKAVIVSTPDLPFDVVTAHNMPFARFIMRSSLVGYFAIKRMSYYLHKANGDAYVFLKSPHGKQMCNGLSPSDLHFFSNTLWTSLMYQSMTEAFRQSNQGIKAVVQEHQIFMNPWGFSFNNIPEGTLFIWHGAEDKTTRVSNAFYLHKKIVHSNLQVFEKKGHYVMFENLEELGIIFKKD